MVLDDNCLDHAHLDTVFQKAPLLSVCSFRKNRVVRVPRSILSLKKLKALHLEDNPVGWPLRPAKSEDWKKAVQKEPPGRRVFRIYEDESREGRVHFADLEVVVMSDPMYKDKDEDRSDVRFGGCAWSPEQLFEVPLHDRNIRNRFGDPDMSRPPWYRNELEGGVVARVFPAEWLSVTVCDGHGGYWVAEALKQNLLIVRDGWLELCYCISQLFFAQKLMAAKLTEKQLPENHSEVVTKLYRDVDQILLARLEAGAGCKKDGATCVNVICNANHILVSHVGDSRCVLGYESSGQVDQVTIDHEPDLPAERERVEKKGGKIEFFPNNAGGGVWRVCGDLAMTRSFGDPNVKPFTSCDPDVALRKKGLFEIDAMVVASDGLWHHVSSEEAIKAVRKCETAEVAACKLFDMVQSAIRKGKNNTFGIDNTMICVVKVARGSQPADSPRIEQPV